MIGWYIGAALLVGAAFILGGWIGHVHAERVAAERWLSMTLRIRKGRALLVDATIARALSTEGLAIALSAKHRDPGVPLALELDIGPQVDRAAERGLLETPERVEREAPGYGLELDPRRMLKRIDHLEAWGSSLQDRYGARLAGLEERLDGLSEQAGTFEGRLSELERS